MLYDKTLRKYIYFRDRGSCYYCGKRLTLKNCTLDHYLPRSKMGPNEIFNIVLCCKTCNKEKGEEVFKDWPQVFTELFKKGVIDGIIEWDVPQTYIKEIITKINKVEILTKNSVVFQGGGFRITLRKNCITNIVLISETEEFN